MILLELMNPEDLDGKLFRNSKPLRVMAAAIFSCQRIDAECDHEQEDGQPHDGNGSTTPESLIS